MQFILDDRLREIEGGTDDQSKTIAGYLEGLFKPLINR